MDPHNRVKRIECCLYITIYNRMYSMRVAINYIYWKGTLPFYIIKMEESYNLGDYFYHGYISVKFLTQDYLALFMLLSKTDTLWFLRWNLLHVELLFLVFVGGVISCFRGYIKTKYFHSSFHSIFHLFYCYCYKS